MSYFNFRGGSLQGSNSAHHQSPRRTPYPILSTLLLTGLTFVVLGAIDLVARNLG